jgi:hypothetical protein
MQITDVFRQECLMNLTDSDYRTNGIHYSDLQAIAQKNFHRLNPATREQAQEELNNNEAIVAGNGFEMCITKPEDFNKLFIVKDFQKPSYTEGKLVDVLIEQNISLNDSERIYEILIANEFWKSSSEKEKRKIASELSVPIRGYIEQEKKSYPKGSYFISADTRNSIITAAEAAKNRYIKNDKFYFYDIMLTDGKYTVKLDAIEVCSKNQMVTIYDFKYKFSKRAEIWSDTFWYYGYWIQPLLYNRVVENALLKELNLNFDFIYVIGSNVNPKIVDLVSVDVRLIPDGGLKPHLLTEGIRSLESLEKELKLRQAMNEWSRDFIVHDLKQPRRFL